LSFVLGQDEKGRRSSSSSFPTQCKIKEKFKKLTKEGRVQNVTRDIGDGDGEMELTLKQQVMMMAQWSSH